MQGTQRWHPDKGFKVARNDFEKMLRKIHNAKNVTVQSEWRLVGDSYAISQEEPIVRSLLKHTSL